MVTWTGGWLCFSDGLGIALLANLITTSVFVTAEAKFQDYNTGKLSTHKLHNEMRNWVPNPLFRKKYVLVHWNVFWGLGATLHLAVRHAAF